MSDKNGEATVDTTSEELGKFTGFAVHDGETIKPEAKQTGGKAQGVEKTTPAKAAAATKAAPTKRGSDDEDDAGDDDDTVAPAAEQRAKSAQDRINKAVAKQRSAERERDAATARFTSLESRLAAIEGGRATPAAQTAQTPSQRAAVSQQDPEPDVAKYEYGEADAKYIRDLARWEVRQELAAAETRKTQQAQQQQLTTEQQKEQKQRDDFFAKGAAKFGDDFESIVGNESIKIALPLYLLLLDSDNGTDIAFDIASDPDLGKKVSAMTPARQAAWFGSYEEANYSSDTADADGETEEEETPVVKPSKPISKAPPPPKHKNKGGGKSETTTADTNDFAAFEAMASKQR